MADKDDLLNTLRIDRQTQPRRRARGPLGERAASVGAGATMAVAGVLAGRLLKSTSPPSPPPITSTETTNAIQTPAGMSASGYVVVRRRATVAAETTGRVLDIGVEEGDVVEQAQSALTSVHLPATRRFASNAGLRDVEARVSVLSERLEEASALHGASQGELRRANAQLERHQIRAPFSGVIVDLAAQAGENVLPPSANGGFTRTGVCTIVDMKETEVEVSEAQITSVAAGQPVTAVLEADPDVPANRDRTTHRVDAADPRILPEMAVNVTVLEPNI